MGRIRVYLEITMNLAITNSTSYLYLNINLIFRISEKESLITLLNSVIR